MIATLRPHRFMRKAIFGIGLAVATLNSSFAQDVDVPPLPKVAAAEAPPAVPFGINFTAEWIEVDLTSLPALLRKHGGEVDSTPLYEEVGELIKSGKAKSVEVVFGRLNPFDDRCKIESIEEVIYPTEYDPAEIPNTVGLDKDSDAALIPSTPPNPTAFETRNTGVTVELETAVDENNRFIDVNLAPEHVEFLERDYHVAEEDIDDSLLAAVWSPRFYTMRITTRVRMKTNSIALVGTFTPHDEENTGKRLMLFIQAFTLSEAATNALQPTAGGEEENQ